MWQVLIINLTILECKLKLMEAKAKASNNNKSNHIGM